MIANVYGKIGGGKTYYSVRFEILPELLEGHRIIVTNIALDLGELAAYLQKRYPDREPIDLHHRIRLLSIDEMGEFFRHRHHGCVLDVPSLDEWRKGANVCYDFDPTKGPEKDAKGNYVHLLPPVKYVLDEVHVKFDSRGWQSQGPHVTFYNSQHRKLNDEIVFISQFPDLVDKRLKGFAQEHVYLENLGIQRVFTVFRPPAYFVAKSYLKERTNSVQDVAQWTTRFRLDLDIARCYDTSAGVGIKGRKQPETRKRKGISIGWAGAGLAVAGFGALQLLDWLPRKVVGSIADISDTVNESGPIAAASGAPVQSPVSEPPAYPRMTVQPLAQAQPDIPPIANDQTPDRPLFVKGMAWSKGRYLFLLSDGRVLDERSGLVLEHTSNFVRLRDGSTLWVLQQAAVPRSENPPPVAPAGDTTETPSPERSGSETVAATASSESV